MKQRPEPCCSLIRTEVILLQGRKALAISITAAAISFALQIMVELPLEMRINAVVLPLIYPNVYWGPIQPMDIPIQLQKSMDT